MKLLFKRDSKGRAIRLKVYVYGNTLVQEQGLIMSTKVTSKTKVFNGKKAKDGSFIITPEDQAQEGLKTIISELLAKGYTEDIASAKTI